MQDKIYGPNDYNTGELNLLKMERAMIVQRLAKHKNYVVTCFSLGIGKKTMMRKIKSHKIEWEEWNK